MRFGQHIGDLDVLWAGLHTLAALFAVIGTEFRLEPLKVSGAGHLGVLEKLKVVVCLKDLRNVHTKGTGHTILAGGTRHGGVSQHLLSRVFQQGKLFVAARVEG